MAETAFAGNYNIRQHPGLAQASIAGSEEREPANMAELA
jgi:hypothetical protein